MQAHPKAPSMMNEMRRNLFALHPSLHDFPKPPESSSKLSVAMICHPNTKALEPHQRMRNHFQQDQLLGTIS